MKTITVTIAPDGSTTVETHGFPGSSCQAGSQFLERALGAKRTEQLTAEYFQQSATEQPLQERRPT